MKIPSVPDIIKAMRNKGYTVYSDPDGYDLNIVGIRAKNIFANRFDDLLTVFYRFQDQWGYVAFPATTDPGTYWLENPMVKLGTAILAPGQYRAAYKIGKHHGKYDALVQTKPVTVFRDRNRDNRLDVKDAITDTGMFGINIHHATRKGKSNNVEKWSAGCQVIQNSNEFEVLMSLARVGRERFGNCFTYTLLDEKDIKDS